MFGSFQNEIRDAVLETIGNLSDSDGVHQTFTWRPDTGPIEIPCVARLSDSSLQGVFGGHEAIENSVLYVLTENFLTADSTLILVDSTLLTADNDTPRPIVGMRLTFRGVKYKISSCGLDSSGVYMKITLGDRFSGR